MRSLFTVSLAAFVIWSAALGAASAQADGGTIRYRPTEEIAAARADQPTRPPLPALWRASRGDADVYLFGTLHILPDDVEWRGPAFADAMADAETTYFETETDSPRAQREMNQLVQRYGLSQRGKLSTRVGPERWARFSASAASLGLNASDFEGYEPWLAILSLTLAAIDKTGFSSGEGVDDALQAQAGQEGDDVKYLEPLKTQILALASLDADDALANFDASLEDLDNIKKETDALLAAWRTGDVAMIESLALEDLRAQAPIAYEALFVARNDDWLRQIDRMLSRNSERDAFVAVGAGHLVGSEGLIARLKASGAEVERLQ
ncbi:MAG: TraB/GumN family protein [Pseudomonadota bacterium]